jgi:hypothetical protein
MVAPLMSERMSKASQLAPLMAEWPRTLKLPHGLQVLTYEGPDGFRIANWTVLSKGNDAYFRGLVEPDAGMRARRFPTLFEVIEAVTKKLYLG